MLYQESFSVAICAWVFFEVLTAPGMVFEKWYTMLERLAEKGYGNLAKPLGLCGPCHAGQWGFWWYMVGHRADWRFGELIVFTCQTIAGFLIIKKMGEITESWSNKLKKG